MSAEIFQGEDKAFTVSTNEDLSSATEIQVTVDTPKAIRKTLTGGDISAVTSSEFTVQFAAGDTATTCSGSYKWQVQAVIGGNTYVAPFRPNRFVIKDNVALDAGSGNDYN